MDKNLLDKATYDSYMSNVCTYCALHRRHTHQHQQQRHYHIKTSHTKVLSSRIILSGNPDFPLTFQVDLRKVLSRWITLSLKYVTSGIILSANFRIQVEFGTDFHCSWIYSNPLEIEINLRFLICNIVI